MRTDEIQMASVAARVLQALSQLPQNTGTFTSISDFDSRVQLARDNALLYSIFFLQKANKEIQGE